MKKAKKLLVTLLVLTFVLSTMSIGFAQDSTTPTSVTRAQALGYLKGDEKGNLNLDQPITRVEALAMIIRISGLEGSADLMKGQTKFTDVNKDPGLAWATGYINLGVGQGIIKGFPDGTFQGRKNVTYAEMAKMLLYAMNYGVTVEGTPWPAGVMGKADDLDLFDGVNASPNVPALRGDVVEMIDNSLTVKHLVQKGYGDLKTYEEGDDTFLSKMEVDELDDVTVTKIDKIDGSKLDENEIVLTDEDGNDTTYTLKADINAEAILGLKVDAWVNDNDEVFFIKVKTEDDDILTDSVTDDTTITSDANGDKVLDKLALYVNDEAYDVAENAKLYINFQSVDVEDLPSDYDEPTEFNGLYGKVVLEKGEVVFANLFKFEDKGLVTNVEDGVIEFENLADASDDELDTEDYDNVFVYNKDFSAANIEDINADSLVAFWDETINGDDNAYVVVVNDKVEGKLERIKDTQVKVAGTSYDVADEAIASLDKGDSYVVWDDLTDIEDLADENVAILLDLNGEAVAIRGDVDVTSDTIYGIATYAKVEKDGVVTVFTKDGEKVDYTAEDRADISPIKYTDTFDYFGAADSLTYAIVAFKLNSDGEIDKDEAFEYLKVTHNTVPAGGDQAANGSAYTLSKSEDKDFVTDGPNKFYITEDTAIFKALNSDEELDPEVVSYDSLVDMAFNNQPAVVFGTAGKDADMIVFLDKDFEGSKDDIYFGVVTDSPWKVGSDYIAKIDVATEGESEYTVDNKVYFDKGALVAFKLNSSNEAVQVVYDLIDNNPADNLTDSDAEIIRGAKVFDIDGSYIILDNGSGAAGDVYKVASDAVIYNITYDDGYKLGDKIRLSKLDKDDMVSLLVDEDDIVRAIIVRYAEDVAAHTPSY